MDVTANLRMPYILPAQAQKHVTHNEAIRMLDVIAQAGALDRDLTTPPPAPGEGDTYIVATSASGDWIGHDHSLAAWQDGAWAFYEPQTGWLVWIADENTLVVWDGAAWILASAGSGVTPSSLSDGSHDLVGVNGAIADATNRLSVKTPAALFDSVTVAEGGAGDCRVIVNKEAVGDTASHLFQTGFSGRAEFGLTGSDDFQVKVSADGAAWTDALTITSDGKIGIGVTSPSHAVSVGSDFGVAVGSNAIVSGGGVGEFPGLGFGKNNNSYAHFFWDEPNNKAVYRVRDGATSNFMEVSSSTTTFNNAVVVGAPTGGSKGVGAINAQAVYDDNTLLSCYVFDQVLEGDVDIAKWDAKTPDQTEPAVYDLHHDEKSQTMKKVKVRDEQVVARSHHPLRQFKARIGTSYDPLTLDGYARHWKEKRHLTAMPNEAAFDPVNGQLTTGEWIQRLVETVEIQAVLIEALNERTKRPLTAPVKPGRS